MKLLFTTMKNVKIVIIGAGAAGLSSAVKLLENGFTNITILEAENRIGGRINSVLFENKVIDLGAQWCHGEEDNIVFKHVRDLDLLETSKCKYVNMQFYDSTGNMVDKDITDMLNDIAHNLVDNDAMKDLKNSFGNYFIEKYVREVKKHFGSYKRNLDIANSFIDWFNLTTIMYNACNNWFELSTCGLAEYTVCSGDLLLNWKSEGFKKFLDVLMKNHPVKNNGCILTDKILLNKKVKTITWNTQHSFDQLSIRCSDDSLYKADHVIVTVSAGVLKHQHKSIFYPQLPAYKIKAFESLGFGIVNKIFLKFPYQWWPKEESAFCFLWSEDDKMNVLNEYNLGPTKNGKSWLHDINGFYVIDSDPQVLMAWMVGEFAGEVERIDDKVIEKGCMYLLQKFLGDIYEIPEPANILCSRWSTNENFYGSYSFKTLGIIDEGITAEHLSRPLNNDKKPVVLFGGEHTHPKYFSTVHGATESGFREADRIINYYKRYPENNFNLTSKY